MKAKIKNITLRILLGLFLINHITPLWSQNVVISNFEEWETVGDFEVPSGWVPWDNPVVCPENITMSSDSYQEDYSLQLGDHCLDFDDLRNLINYNHIEKIYSQDLVSFNFFYKLAVSEDYYKEKKGCIYVFARVNYAVNNLEQRYWCIEKEEDVSEWTHAQFDFGLVKHDTIKNIWFLFYCGLCDNGIVPVGNSVCNIDSMYFALKTPTNTQDFSIPEILIHPNPTQGFVNLQSSDRVSYFVHNFKGERIVKTNMLDRNHLIDLAEFPSGVYFVSLFDAENVFIGSRKVVKY